MSQPRTETRPPQVLWGACLAAVAGALLVVSTFDTLSNLRSLSTRAVIVKELHELGLGSGDLAHAIPVLHVLLLLAGGAAAVATILAGFALTGHAGARIGLTVAAVAALLCALAPSLMGSVILAAMLGAAVGMLWSGPARDWFAGRPVREWKLPTPPEISSRSSAERPNPFAPPPGPPESHRTPPPPTGPQPGQQSGQQPGQQPQPPMPYAGFGRPMPGYPPAYAYPRPAHQPGVRPGNVVAAALITWVSAGLTAVVGLSGVLMFGFERDLVAHQARSGAMVSLVGHQVHLTNRLMTQSLVISVAMVLLSLAACALAFFVMSGHDRARTALTACGVISMVPAILAAPFGLPVVIAIAVTIALMYSPMSSPWFRGGGSAYAGQPPAGPPTHQPPHEHDDDRPVW